MTDRKATEGPFDARPLTREDERKIAAYDAARAAVKIEGGTRAYYVLRIQALEAALERIALGIGGRQESGLLDNEGEDYLPTHPKPDWKLAREALGRA